MSNFLWTVILDLLGIFLSVRGTMTNLMANPENDSPLKKYTHKIGVKVLKVRFDDPGVIIMMEKMLISS